MIWFMIWYIYIYMVNDALVGGDWWPFFWSQKILGSSNHPNWRNHLFQRGGLTTNQISTISDSAFTTGILPFVCKGPSKCSASCLPSLALIWRFARMAVGADTTALVFSWRHMTVKSLQEAQFLSPVDIRSLTKNVRGHLNRPDMKAEDRPCDSYQVRLGALALRERMNDVIYYLCKMKVSSGNQFTVFAKLKRAASKRAMDSQREALEKYGGSSHESCWWVTSLVISMG